MLLIRALIRTGITLDDGGGGGGGGDGDDEGITDILLSLSTGMSLLVSLFETLFTTD